jgi:hypothetical protein
MVEFLRPVEVCAWAPECDHAPTSAVAGVVFHPSGAAAAAVALVCELHVGFATLELGQVVAAVVRPVEDIGQVLAIVEAFGREVERHGT